METRAMETNKGERGEGALGACTKIGEADRSREEGLRGCGKGEGASSACIRTKGDQSREGCNIARGEGEGASGPCIEAKGGKSKPGWRRGHMKPRGAGTTRAKGLV